MIRESNAQDGESVRILYLGADPATVELALGQLVHAGLQIEPAVVVQSRDFKERVSSQSFDLVLAEYRLRDWDGLSALHWLRGSGYDTPVVLVSEEEGIELALEYIKEGAADCVLKNDLVRLPGVVLLAVCEEELRREQQVIGGETKTGTERRLFFQNNSYPMWVYDHDTLAFLAVNEAAIRSYGYSRCEFLRMTILDIRPVEDVIPVLRSAWMTHSDRLPNPEVWRHRFKGGRILQVEITGCNLRFRGKDARLILAKEMAGSKKASESSSASPMRKAFGFGK
jgi:CheY-like chemotaxis protein